MSEYPRSALPDGAALRGGEYVIQSCLGRGGFAITYRASEPGLARQVAIKELFPRGCVRVGRRLAPGGEWTAEALERYRRRFRDEGRRLAALHHPGIVAIHAVFEENDTVYLVMELVEGVPLDHLLAARGGRLGIEEALSLTRQAGEALTVVHSAGLLHRDVKPANLIRRPDGSVVLVDFGSAREFLPHFRQTGTVVISHGYAPPEQYVQGAQLGYFTDVYGLAATLYCLLTGEAPLAAPARAQGMELASVAERRPETPLVISETVMQGLSMRGEDRPASVRDFLTEVSRPVGSDVFLVAPRLRVAFFWRFVWVSAVGGTVGVVAGMSAGNLTHRAQPESVAAAWAISGAFTGLGVGLAQWVALRRLVRQVWLWPVLTTIASSLGNVLGWAVGEALGWQLKGSYWDVWGVTGAVLGATVGCAQWLLLRREVKAARWWITATIFGKILGNMAAVTIVRTAGTTSPMVAGWVVGNVVVVVAQGLCLSLFRRKQSGERPERIAALPRISEQAPAETDGE